MFPSLPLTHRHRRGSIAQMSRVSLHGWGVQPINQKNLKICLGGTPAGSYVKGELIILDTGFSVDMIMVVSCVVCVCLLRATPLSFVGIPSGPLDSQQGPSETFVVVVAPVVLHRELLVAPQLLRSEFQRPKVLLHGLHHDPLVALQLLRSELQRSKVLFHGL